MFIIYTKAYEINRDLRTREYYSFFLRWAPRMLGRGAERLKRINKAGNERAYTLMDHSHHKRFTLFQKTVLFL
jgi:hypothetical protein